ncbi:MAG: TonB-dependent receptor plug domain-containing protein, partial [Thermodesulfobacteriota bacterium]|nr:TonB-dependent receptor plug domain-containing protein [Thermodesulfobacteriota bacterium]
LPQGDGAITDLFKVLPGIQFSEVDNSSLTGGEILPAEISISGGRVYDNNFMIDGLGNNSLLDPTASNPSSSTMVPGHSQELFLDTSLIDTISIYRSNISARYSGFSGGVVDALTRDPGDVFSGQISGRTTRSQWASFHVDKDGEEDFTYSEDADRQPEFRKYYANGSVDVPLTENMGVLLSYSRTYSQIPLWNFDEKHNQYRDMENLFVKYLYRPTNRTTLRLSYLSTPYEGEYFRDDVKDSNYTVQGGGWSVSANLEHQFSFANAEFVLGVRNSENSRQSPDNYFNYQVTPSADWGERYSRKGGFGDVETEQKSITAAGHFAWTPFTLLGIVHEWKNGLTLERSVADYSRSKASNSAWKISDQVVCDGDSVFCIADEQYAYSKVVYPEDEADAEISFIDLYLEDTLNWGRLSLRPGIHIGYNDFSKNTDYAARSVVFYDVFADGATIFSAGANRYYGKTFLTLALNEEKQPTSRWSRSLNGDNTLTPWVEKKRTRFALQRVSDLDTPYVDEWSVGLEQDLLRGRLTLAYIDRNGENQLGKEVLDRDENGYTYSEWNNNGESRHKEVTASWERQWDKHYLFVDATWQDSQSSNEDYDDMLELDDLEELVWYNDHTTYLINLPRSDYNREWSANLIYSVSMPYGFSFTNIIRYRSGYEAITDTRDNYVLPDGEKIDIYADVSCPSATTFDWKLEWEYPLTGIQTLTISADVTNVFNRKLYAGADGEYEMGRQLWVGVDYSF